MKRQKKKILDPKFTFSQDSSFFFSQLSSIIKLNLFQFSFVRELNLDLHNHGVAVAL